MSSNGSNAACGFFAAAVELTDAEVDSLLAFLDSLTGTPPRLTVPILPAEQALTPPPLPPLLEE